MIYRVSDSCWTRIKGARGCSCRRHLNHPRTLNRKRPRHSCAGVTLPPPKPTPATIRSFHIQHSIYRSRPRRRHFRCHTLFRLSACQSRCLWLVSFVDLASSTSTQSYFPYTRFVEAQLDRSLLGLEAPHNLPVCGPISLSSTFQPEISTFYLTFPAVFVLPSTGYLAFCRVTGV
jgi:hypothetical protein